jgi:hypothetical protein
MISEISQGVPVMFFAVLSGGKRNVWNWLSIEYLIFVHSKMGYRLPIEPRCLPDFDVVLAPKTHWSQSV